MTAPDRAPEPTAAATTAAATAAPGPATRIPLIRDLQLLIVVLLGIASVATAYVSFQGSLYSGMQSSAYSKGGAAQTEAESLYLEANQQYLQDAQTLTRMTELAIDMESSDPEVAQAASAKFDAILFTAVSEELQAAIDWSAAQNEADPDDYIDPQSSEDYRTALFGAWAEYDAESERLLTQGDEYNAYGDRLTLNTVLLAITLFLLGVAAVLSSRRAQWVLIGVGAAIFVVAVALTAMVPFVWL